MSLITKDHLSLTLQTIKSLLSFKADKTELDTKIDRSEIEEDDSEEDSYFSSEDSNEDSNYEDEFSEDELSQSDY